MSNQPANGELEENFVKLANNGKIGYEIDEDKIGQYETRQAKEY
jgi:hypothetical protein